MILKRRYQNLHYRLHYDATHPKHLRFCNTYIYAFTWEDDLADARLLNVTSSDVILAITSAGDNILSFLLSQPRRVHAVDLNPAQNHLLELKIAAFSALGYQDVWKLFGEGRHEGFREILQKLSPWLSSAAFQFWMQNGPSVFESNKNKKGGLYFSGCSGSVLQLVSLVFKVLGLKKEVERLCSASTMEEQIGIWERSLKPVLHSKILTWAVLSNEKWLWKALGVPPAQRDMIVSDYHMRKHHQQNGEDVPAASHPGPEEKRKKGPSSGNAIYEYVLHTFEPIIHTTLLSTSNPYYLLTLLANYTPTCHPTYLSRASYTHLSSSSGSAFNNLRIHTDELSEVLARMCPGTLTIVVVMDSMDWFPREGKGRNKAGKQVRVLNKALVVGGRVLLRSAGVRPWYLRVFEEGGFRCECVGVRRGEGGVCVDR